jgi:tetratricopeptide (TPR) repeat protein
MLTKTSTKAAHQGDVVELTKDLTQYGFARGQRGIVISEFENPEEAYDLEMQGEDGSFLGFAYSVKTNQFSNVSEGLVQDGLTCLVNNQLVEAEKKFRRATELNPKCKGIILNSILKSFGDPEHGEEVLVSLRVLCRALPDYQLARDNLAVAYVNDANDKTRIGDYVTAQMRLMYAIGLEVRTEIVLKIQEGLAGVLTAMAEKEQERGDLKASVALMQTACATFPSGSTRHNLRIAHAKLARFSLEQNDPLLASSVFEKIEEEGLFSPELLNLHALALFTMGQTEAAKSILERALEIEPDNQVLQENLRKIDSNQDSLEELPTHFIPIITTRQDYQLAA